jgi:hypothetical protein
LDLLQGFGQVMTTGGTVLGVRAADSCLTLWALLEQPLTIVDAVAFFGMSRNGPQALGANAKEDLCVLMVL